MVNLWGGVADPATNTRWKKDTLSVFFSATKGITAITIAHLVDRYAVFIIISAKFVYTYKYRTIIIINHGIVQCFSFDGEEQPFNLNNGKFSFTIHCVPLV